MKESDPIPPSKNCGCPQPNTIEQADFKDYLSRISPGSIDLVLTDPPYTISRKTGFQRVVKGVQRFAVNMDFGEWDHGQIDLDALAEGSYRALRDGGSALIFYDVWKITPLSEAMERAGFKQLRLIIWEKTNPVPLNSKRNYLSNTREIAVLGVKKGKPTFHSEYDNGIYSFPIPREKRGHPTQKPIRLIRALIEKHSNPGDAILDCFVGSGTTAAAALKLGRTFFACEIDPDYLAFSRERIAALQEED